MVYHFPRTGLRAQLIVRYRRDNRPEPIVTPMSTGLWLVYEGKRISQMHTRLLGSKQWRTKQVHKQITDKVGVRFTTAFIWEGDNPSSALLSNTVEPFCPP
ncbi:hypothetical protein NFHSH190041_17010 [Shewanella sp. NFH-SH190041]|uniref:hypothetical protein n=1 Tax=Shewanella sp. NFH-SH190041 TaxID=2950245 RepID=UPI0021C2B022|nr:hypothetical protein [Shewanella sp. NFH-SH190041]BDM64249.1 hypothetical protein NFHSH190041_17010 [Shewanella sp. NFH-SH190041]